MSNRTIEQASGLAELRLAHEVQIEALTAPGLTREERIRKFCEAAGVEECINVALLSMDGALYSFAYVVWWNTGGYPRSLFAYLPRERVVFAGKTCGCPVQQNMRGRAHFPGIPSSMSLDWAPTRETLEAFARVQQQARFPEARAA